MRPTRRARPGAADGGREIVIGPVQATLLEAIRTGGTAAQRQMGGSYAHVWKLVAAMNEAFPLPLVDSVRGGGAILTEERHKALDSFRQLKNQLKRSGRAELLVISGATSHAVARQQ